ncbi:MAG TPA: hydroxymethylglutaryl-CoA synthase [Rectinemataceae bacterium]|nr:hydroxymethylglutaryl-CoA synthase [Rectinemataceae bacterium]
MNERKVGIGDMRFYVPARSLDMAALVEARGEGRPDLGRRLERALATTGQRAMRFPRPGEDAATMAAAAAYELLAANPGRSLANLRYVVAGTESGVDHAKPLSSYVIGMLERAGMPLGHDLASFQVQHACAGGSLGLLSVASLLAASGREGDTGLVTASDVSRYDLGSTAEITQGAGAAAILVESRPRLLEIELGTVGYSSRDVDDFFRPLGSDSAKVKGSYSMECYVQALEEAFSRHCEAAGAEPEQLLDSTDILVLHTPFKAMPETAMRRLLKSRLGLGEGEASRWLDLRGFPSAVDIVADIGNAYAASLFIVLGAALRERRASLGEGIVGKRVLIASYGSGNVMALFSARVASGAPEVIDGWSGAWMSAPAGAASVADYERWRAGAEVPGEDEERLPFILDHVRDDGYREYRHGRCRDHEGAQAGAAGDLREARALPC